VSDYQIGVKWLSPGGDLLELRDNPNIRLTNDGLAGLRQGPTEAFTRSAAGSDGDLFQGWRALARSILLPIDVHSTLDGPIGALDYYALQTRVDRAFRPDRNGTLYVTAPDGSTRQLDARLAGDEGDELAIDPTVDAGLTTVYSLISDLGYWFGPWTWRRLVEANAGVRSFYDADGDGNQRGPDFYQSDDYFTGRATLTNPGDVDAWPIWEFNGPHEGIDIVVQGRLIRRTRPLAAGHQLTIDTRDRQKVAWLRRGGEGTPLENVTGTFDSFQLARIPDGDEVPVNVIVHGTGSARVGFQPRYFRAFG
jgi:hypothetical protein